MVVRAERISSACFFAHSFTLRVEKVLVFPVIDQRIARHYTGRLVEHDIPARLIQEQHIAGFGIDRCVGCARLREFNALTDRFSSIQTDLIAGFPIADIAHHDIAVVICAEGAAIGGRTIACRHRNTGRRGSGIVDLVKMISTVKAGFISRHIGVSAADSSGGVVYLNLTAAALDRTFFGKAHAVITAVTAYNFRFIF